MMQLAVDLGSSVTKIYLAGSGVVLAEPSCLALAAGTGRVLAVGEEAVRMIGESRELLNVLFPVAEGEVSDERAAGAMLSYFLRKVGIPPRRAHGMEALFCVHCGASDEALASFRRVADACGIGIVRFAEVPMLSAFGQGLAPDDERPVFLIDVGGGSTNIAALSAFGTEQGVGLSLGSGNLDSSIIAAVQESHGVRLRRQEAERLKIAVGSLYTGDNASLSVAGYERESGRPCTLSVAAADIAAAVRLFADRLVQYSRLVLEKLPKERAAFVLRRGVRLSGGGAQLTGLADYISAALGTQVQSAERPQYAAIAGAGRAIERADILRLVCIEE